MELFECEVMHFVQLWLPGPLMMIISLMVFVMGIAYLLGRKISHKADKKQMALLRERLYPQTSLVRNYMLRN